MTNVLPSTPLEVLDISTPEFHAKILNESKAAKETGKWIYPDPEAATDLAEMGEQDIYYWVYKCENPILYPEKGVSLESFMRDNSIVKLPESFERVSTVTIGAAGDLLQADGLENSKNILFEEVSPLLFDKDISIANFESPVTTQPLVKEVIGDKAAPVECCNESQFNTLAQHNGKYFTVFNTANNHILDMGIEGIKTTWETMSKNSILDVGTNRTQEEYGQAKTLVKNGIKIGFVSATFGLNGQNFNEEKLPKGEEFRINTAKLMSKFSDPDLSLLKEQIADAQEKKCDFIIAFVHWGFEFELAPREKQRKAAYELAECGADLIMCHHPHVIQPVEYYSTKRDKNRIVPIAYSLGSVTWGFTAPHLALCLIQNLTLTKGKFQGNEMTYVEEADVTPVFRMVTEKEGVVESRIVKLSDHAQGDTNYPQEYIDQMKYYVDSVLGKSRSSDEQKKLIPV